MTYEDAIAKYFDAVYLDGDWLNDWLTHLPDGLVDLVMAFGHMTATMFGL